MTKAQPVPDLLRAWRAQHGLSQSTAAERLGISKRTLQDWEAGERRKPSATTEALLRIALQHV